MKKIKYLMSAIIMVFMVIACSEDDNTLDVDGIAAPTNVSAAARITSDNTGLVTLTPLGEGVTKFDLMFGDGSEGAEDINPGSSVTHTYAEGSYDITITAYGLNGLSTTVTQPLVVSFEPPQNLMVTIENDPTISKQVNVTASADLAIYYEVDFGEAGSEVVQGNNEETVSFVYQEAGIYTITVTAFSGAIETLSYTEDFEVTAILQPLAAAPTPPSRAAENVISVYSNAYDNLTGTDFYPNWGQSTTFNEITVGTSQIIQYGNLNYQGIQLGSSTDVSAMEYLHVDIWTADDNDAKISPISSGPNETAYDLDLTAQQWTSFDIPLSFFTDQNPLVNFADIIQFKFDGDPAGGTIFVDNLYFYRAPSTAFSLVGTWQMAPEAGALGVGPAVGDTSWWNCDAGCVTTRACYYDDLYIFGSDGSFTNDLGADSWIEPWQGGSDACGPPAPPYDGSASATYTYNAGANTVTLNGTGAFLGLPKANNQGELPNVAVPSSITYNVTVIDDNTISVYIEAGAGVFWQYRMIRTSAPSSPITGTWKMAEIAGSLGVGPAVGDIGWWNCDTACVALRDCYYDDLYIFGADGSFMNDLGTASWIEPWQGGSDACGAPVAPHDGSNAATYTYDAGAGTVTLNGTGAFIGIPKANNQGELPNVAVPLSITYNVTLVDTNNMDVYIEAGAGVFWQFKLVKL
ncbi:PKD domain-containing protein [Subsaxibacter sp. CAU 1640]|uniref:PKD domain-containing protein n=1 Tax=Subsaxibacter sp. CAU 1640 TaxID=2933271 RepID=UPI002006BFDE|nr:PKD domain-containing protein [Subsaxibacter sp. CAU 1640]MCK7590667.1 PKD domain-containing protein [Subsaxibacter sp. CAU 1640]